MNSILESTELGSFFARLLLGVLGGVMGFLSIALGNVLRGFEDWVPGLSSLAPISAPVSGMLGQLSGQLAASIPTLNF